MRMKANNLKDKVSEDNRRIAEVYYDPCEDNRAEIESRVTEVVEMLHLK